MTTIHGEFLDIQRRLIQNGQHAVRVSFNNEGFSEAKREQDGHIFFNGSDARGNPLTYCGLPYTIRPAQQGRVALHTNFEYGVERGAVTIKLGFDANSGHVLVDGKPQGDAINIMQIVGRSLSAAQICDLCRAWLDSDNASPWGPFEEELDTAILEHGTFE